MKLLYNLCKFRYRNNEDLHGNNTMKNNDNNLNKAPPINYEKVLVKKGREQVWGSESSDLKENETPDHKDSKGCSMF